MTIGIAGPIASGKSTVAALIQQQIGGTIIDADKVVHDLYLPNQPGWQKIVQHFNKSIIEQNLSINRSKLGEIVFNDPQKLKLLNQLIHPLVTAEISHKIQDQNLHKPIIIEAFEFLPQYLGSLINTLIYISTTPEICIKNAQSQRQLSTDYIKKILSHQNPPSTPNFIIKNTHSLQKLKDQVNQLVPTLQSNL